MSLANVVQQPEPVTLKQFYDFDYKDSCRVATTTNGTLSSAFANGQTIDGVTLATGNRILIKNQTDSKKNGIYTVNASGAPTRAIDANSSSKVTSGLFTSVSEGTANADKSFVLTTNDANDAIVLDTTALAFAEITAGTADNSVTLAKMAGIVRGKIIVGNASGDPSYLSAGANGKILVADANGDPSWTTMSGDATISAGALTLASSIDATKIANGTVTSAEFQHISTLSSNAQTQINSKVSQQAFDTLEDEVGDLDDDKAPKASPTFTGVPAAPTAAAGTNTTQLATTAYSLAAVTGSVSTISTLLNTSLKIGRDVTNIIDFGTDNNIILKTANAVIGTATRATINHTGIAIVGALTVTGDITGLTSDKRLKKNIKILSNPLDKLKVLSGFTYDWSLDKCAEAGFEPKDEEQIGVFAQDVQSVIPQAVKPAPFDTDSEGNSISGDNYLTVQYEKIVPLLIECIKEQQKQIDELKNKV